MLKISEHLPKEKLRMVTGDELEQLHYGATFSGSVSSSARPYDPYDGRSSVYLKIYNEIVDLYDPVRTWHINPTLIILDFKLVTVLASVVDYED